MAANIAKLTANVNYLVDIINEKQIYYELISIYIFADRFHLRFWQ